MLEWFPLRITRIMDLATIVIFVAVIIAVDFDLFEFFLQKLDVTLKKNFGNSILRLRQGMSNQAF